MDRRIVHLALVGALSLVASAQARANVSYGGGRVLPSVRIIPIFYGSGWPPSDRAATLAYLTELADYIGGAKNPAGQEYGSWNAASGWGDGIGPAGNTPPGILIHSVGAASTLGF
jgi:hypothetical protein